MSLRRGFKAAANRIAVQLRADIGLRAEDPIDLDVLGKSLDVPIVPLTSFANRLGWAVRQLTKNDPSAFSAVTLPRGDGRHFILHNDCHAPVRQRSNIAHEFSHIVLKHPMMPPLDASGCRQVDRDIEDEAAWLSGVMLIPDQAAFQILIRGLDDKAASLEYGVSLKMLRLRINMSGANIRMARRHVN
ncbi:MAG: ImmA/IrrE family metallo-endopeptidase [Tepidisphaeraceae bacterium]|jgi:Zn-dependent peptidase ImmA (M78 family)